MTHIWIPILSTEHPNVQYMPNLDHPPSWPTISTASANDARHHRLPNILQHRRLPLLKDVPSSFSVKYQKVTPRIVVPNVRPGDTQYGRLQAEQEAAEALLMLHKSTPPFNKTTGDNEKGNTKPEKISKKRKEMVKLPIMPQNETKERKTRSSANKARKLIASMSSPSSSSSGKSSRKAIKQKKAKQ